MNKYFIPKVSRGLALVGLLLLTAIPRANAQFTQNRDTIRIDQSGYSAEMRKDYGVFAVKCGECHSLDKSLKPSLPAAQWTTIVKQMQAMASSHISDKDTQNILDFLNYDESRRKAQLKPLTAVPSNGLTAGRELFSSLGCEACHSIAGKGGDVGPALTEVGAKLSRDQLTEVIKKGKPNTAMPALPPDTSGQQVDQLVDFLATQK